LRFHSNCRFFIFYNEYKFEFETKYEKTKKKKSRHDKTDTRARAREKKTEFTEAEIRAFVTHTRKESVFVRVRGSCVLSLFFFFF